MAYKSWKPKSSGGNTNYIDSKGVVYKRNSLETTIDNIISKNNTQDTSITNINSNITSMNTKITTNTTNITNLTPARIANNQFTANKGSLQVNQSYKIGNVVFINLKMINCTIPQTTTTDVVTINSSIRPAYETPIMVSCDDGNCVIYGWLRTGGTIAVRSEDALSNADIRIITSYILS